MPLGGEQVGKFEDRYLLRATMGWIRGISIDIVSNNRVRAAATIAFGATNILMVPIDSYLGHRYRLKIIPNGLSFEQHIFIVIDRYLLTKAICLQLFDRCLLVYLMGL